MIWGAPIAWYLFLAGASAGAFITSTYVQFKHPENVKVRLIGRIIAPIAVCVGLLLLMIDAEAGLHNPLRFVFLVMNPGSVMTLGVYLLCVYMPISFVVVLLELLHKDVPRWLAVVGCVFAAGVAMYTGFLLGVCASHPLWNSTILPILFLASALSAGAASVGLVALFVDREAFERMVGLKRLHVFVVACEVVLLFAFLTLAASTSPEGAESVGLLVGGTYSLAFWLGLVAAGLVLPLCVQVFGLVRPDAPAALGVVGEVGALVGGWLLRFLVIAAALPVVFVL